LGEVERFGRFFPAGTVLFREGEPGREMYVVHSGKVSLSRRLGDREQIIALLPTGEFFGEMAILLARPRSATARVVEDAWLLVIDAKTFGAMLKTRAEIAARLVQTMAERLQRANQQIELLLLQDVNHRVVSCLRQLSERGTPVAGGGVYLTLTRAELAGRVALPEEEVDEVLGRLAEARLCVVEDDGVIVPEVGRLLDFLEFLEMKERFRVSG
jgi:CRP/FNR family transcriptional regulator, cyclic AMP receptor protein